MNKNETAQALTILRAAYPRPAMTATQFSQMVSVWHDALSDVDFEAVKTAVREHTKQSKWFPSVAEIRDAARPYNQQQTDSEARAMAERLRRSWQCCPVCWHRPCAEDCTARRLEMETAPQLEAVDV